jgi:hypothetical protein
MLCGGLGTDNFAVSPNALVDQGCAVKVLPALHHSSGEWHDFVAYLLRRAAHSTNHWLNHTLSAVLFIDTSTFSSKHLEA